MSLAPTKNTDMAAKKSIYAAGVPHQFASFNLARAP